MYNRLYKGQKGECCKVSTLHKRGIKAYIQRAGVPVGNPEHTSLVQAPPPGPLGRRGAVSHRVTRPTRLAHHITHSYLGYTPDSCCYPRVYITPWCYPRVCYPHGYTAPSCYPPRQDTFIQCSLVPIFVVKWDLLHILNQQNLYYAGREWWGNFLSFTTHQSGIVAYVKCKT